MSIELVLVAVGGGAGAVTRYLTALLAARLWGESFPWGTLIVNLVGCFAIGLVFALGVEGGAIGPRARLFLMTGLLGGLTTFSAFSLETSALLAQGTGWYTVLNVLGNVGGGLLVFMLGVTIGRVML
ncbi:MAG: fluoride efflux transporter CrcB [Armatimonadota bacterium]